jgi:hypothetical protein
MDGASSMREIDGDAAVVGRAPLLDAVEGQDLDALGDRAGGECEVEPALRPRWALRLGVVGRDAVRAPGEF